MGKRINEPLFNLEVPTYMSIVTGDKFNRHDDMSDESEMSGDVARLACEVDRR